MGQGHRYYEEKTRRIPVQGLGHLYKINTILLSIYLSLVKASD
jgi:hypothetical protein